MRFIILLTVAFAQGCRTSRHDTEILEHRVGQGTNFTDHFSTSATLDPLMKRLALLLVLSSSMTSSTDAFAQTNGVPPAGVRVLQHNAEPALGLSALGPLDSLHNPLDGINEAVAGLGEQPEAIQPDVAKAIEVDPDVVEGTDLRVLKYPHPSLRAENSECSEEELKDGSIAKIAKEMLLVMYAAQGIGLAAPQVGVNKRLMVYNEYGDKKRWLDQVTLVNPKIVEYSEAKDEDSEGCLSFPDMSGKVQRSKWIKVEAQNIKGKKMKKKFKGWEARIFQHEYDHLDGVVYIDRLDEENRFTVQPKLDELVEEFGEGGDL